MVPPYGVDNNDKELQSQKKPPRGFLPGGSCPQKAPLFLPLFLPLHISPVAPRRRILHSTMGAVFDSPPADLQHIGWQKAPKHHTLTKMKSPRKPVCILVAAGESSRMGEWKLMLPFGDATIVAASLKSASMVCRQVIVVGGYRHRELETHLKSLGIGNFLFTVNHQYRKGMFSSIQQGARRLEGKDFFIALADMPLILPGHYRMLLDKSETPEGTEADILRPLLGDKPAHPVYCRSRVAATILDEPADSAMKHVLARHRVLEIAGDEEALFLDADTPEGYRKLLEQLQSKKGAAS
jgi:molybdenum cofactor cytidylyltransferase